MDLVFLSPHPLVKHKMAALRSTVTPPAEFRRLVRELSYLLAYEATLDLPTKSSTVETPLGQCEAQILAESVGVIPILRAGLGMAEGVLELIPQAEVWHIGLFRDEATHQPTQYYSKLSRPCRFQTALVIDPMLATGGSAARACELLVQVGVSRMKMLALIAAPEGIAAFRRAMPHVPIHVAAIDQGLNEHKFIVPGLGDAGDRQYATS